MTNARGIVGRSIEPVSASLPSMLSVFQFDGNDDSARRRLPPFFCRVAGGSCGLMSLVEPSSALPPADGTSRLPLEHPPATTRLATTASTAIRPALRRINRVTQLMLTARGIRLRDSGQQLLRVLVLRVGEDVVGVAVFHHRPPRYITTTRSARCLTTDRSCETNRYDRSNSRCKSSSRLMMPAWIDTSSADTGSSRARIFGCSASAWRCRCAASVHRRIRRGGSGWRRLGAGRRPPAGRQPACRCSSCRTRWRTTVQPTTRTPAAAGPARPPGLETPPADPGEVPGVRSS